MKMTAGAMRALERLGCPVGGLTAAVVLDEAADLARLEDTMPGRTSVFARASADAMELCDWIRAAR